MYVVSGGWGFSPAEASLCERLLLSVCVEIPFFELDAVCSKSEPDGQPVSKRVTDSVFSKSGSPQAASEPSSQLTILPATLPLSEPASQLSSEPARQPDLATQPASQLIQSASWGVVEDVSMLSQFTLHSSQCL